MEEFWQIRYGQIGKRLPDYADVIDPMSPKKVKKLIDAFESMINKSPQYKGEAWRAMGFRSKKVLHKKFVKGKTVTFELTSSSSTKKRVAEDFLDWARMEGETPVMLRVQSKTGTYLGKLSYQKQEEVMLRAGTKYKVKDMVRIQAKDSDMGIAHYLVDLREI